MEAKRRALDEIATRQRAADEKRQEEAARKQAAMASQSAAAQYSAGEECQSVWDSAHRVDRRRWPSKFQDMVAQDRRSGRAD